MQEITLCNYTRKWLLFRIEKIKDGKNAFISLNLLMLFFVAFLHSSAVLKNHKARKNVQVNTFSIEKYFIF